MAKKSNGTKALVVGTVLGLVAGAAYALWKTPMSGKELRSKFMPEVERDTTASAPGTGITDKVIGVVESTLAPLVGVELGKTANGSGSSPVHTTANGVVETAAEPTTAAPVMATEETAATNVESTTYGTESIRAKRFAWGAPAPEAPKSAPEPVAAPVAPQTPEAAPVEPSADVEAPAAAVAAAPSTYGTESIRAKRFAWGSPAPEISTVGTAAVVAEAVAENPVVSEPVANEPVAAAVAVSARDAQATTEIPATKAGDMHPFPKLGGLE